MIVAGLRRAVLGWLALLGGLSAGYAAQYPVHHPVPGGVAVIKLTVPGAGKLTARFGRKPIMVLNQGGEWYGVVGLDLDAPLGSYVITVRTEEEEIASQEFAVIPFSYPFKTGRPAGRALPVGKPLTWRPELDTDFPLMYPAGSASLEPFGTRYVEGESIVPVRCVMLRVSATVEVTAPGGGAIAELNEYEAGSFYITIDHGMSLHSSIGPITKPRKEQGQAVKKGEVVGEFNPEQTVPTTLNWQVLLNGVNVNPLLFTDGFTLP